jgi:DNA-binding NtrC family response regulator
MKILLVDDDTRASNRAKKLLKGLNCEVVSVRSTRRAMSVFSQNLDAAMAVINCQSDGFNGLELARMMNCFSPTLLIVSLKNESAVKSMRGVDLFLPCPLKTSDLRKISDLLETC